MRQSSRSSLWSGLQKHHRMAWPIQLIHIVANKRLSDNMHSAPNCEVHHVAATEFFDCLLNNRAVTQNWRFVPTRKSSGGQSHSDFRWPTRAGMSLRGGAHVAALTNTFRTLIRGRSQHAPEDIGVPRSLRRLAGATPSVPSILAELCIIDQRRLAADGTFPDMSPCRGWVEPQGRSCGGEFPEYWVAAHVSEGKVDEVGARIHCDRMRVGSRASLG